ncbi:MAG: hypothetical protein RBU37_24565 [Myxococcota bacterium]|jgi:hypothetical protein|nr:hypothetical protein [Myxococcota bacterium]
MRAISHRDLAYCGVFGALALLMPVVFHLVRLGHVFMPMYLPLMALACFVRPMPAASTALFVPLISAAMTGMPPFYPPVALGMATELAMMAALFAAARQRWPKHPVLAHLLPVLLLGRAYYVAFMYAAAQLIDLPAAFVAGLSLLSGWPGIILMVVIIPALHRIRRPIAVPISEAS